MLEEGIDVAACYLVVRYSGVSTLIQYIQSRGRARKCDSWFMVLVTPEEEQLSRHIQEEEGILDLILDTHATQYYLPSEKTLSIIQSMLGIATEQDLQQWCLQRLPRDYEEPTFLLKNTHALVS